MLDRMAVGLLPRKPHTALRSETGALLYEECFTRSGFDGPYTILYHEHRPHAVVPWPTAHAPIAAKSVLSMSRTAEPDRVSTFARHHYRTAELPAVGAAMDSRVPLLFNDDVLVSAVKPKLSDPSYFVNAEADELFFVRAGCGTIRSPFGDLAFASGDYVCVPKGCLYRIILESTEADALLVECLGGVGLPSTVRNPVGQIRMDAPYSHRDFRRPEFRGPLDEEIRDVVFKHGGAYHGFRCAHSPLDVVGWDGAVYPWAFPILAFEPKVGALHLPPTTHGTFAARGALISSFVPRPLDFHPDAIPCPYPHTSVDVDEVIYYVSGEFSSRYGVGVGSITLHPAGLPHGPHPGRYEGSLGARRTEEVAVMLDCERRLAPTVQAHNVEDPRYEASFSSPASP